MHRCICLLYTSITTTFVDTDDESSFRQAINENTKAIFVETIGNPNATLIDLEKVAAIAHAHKVPLVVDNTFATVSYTHLDVYKRQIKSSKASSDNWSAEKSSQRR